MRGGADRRAGFFDLIAGKIEHVAKTRTVALTDASLNAWIHMMDGTEDIYYDKGSLAGLMLDILIRDASDNKRSLDGVMRNLYRDAYKKGEGFTPAEWWSAVSAAAGGRSFTDFDAKYIEGREPYPWSTILPLAGLVLHADTVRSPALGITYEHDSVGAIIIAAIDPGGMAAEAGIRPGDKLVAVGDVAATDRGFLGGAMSRYGVAGETVVIKVRRGGTTLSLPARVQIRERVSTTVTADPRANAKAVAIRTGLMRP